MASRKEQKERLKAERVAKEAAERQETARRRRLQIGAAAAAVVVVAAVIVVIALGGGGGGDDETTSSGIAFSEDSVPASVEAGLQDSPPPWKPDYNGLGERISAMGLPGFSETISPLHTHDTSGIIHMEADREFDFTLGQLMAIWGVEFSDSQIGSLKSQGDQKLQVYLNGQRVNDPVNVIMPEKGNLVIGYGKAGSFPTDPKVDWPRGL